MISAANRSSNHTVPVACCMRRYSRTALSLPGRSVMSRRCHSWRCSTNLQSPCQAGAEGWLQPAASITSARAIMTLPPTGQSSGRLLVRIAYFSVPGPGPVSARTGWITCLGTHICPDRGLPSAGGLGAGRELAKLRAATRTSRITPSCTPSAFPRQRRLVRRRSVGQSPVFGTVDFRTLLMQPCRTGTMHRCGGPRPISTGVLTSPAPMRILCFL